jgi:PAS domain S-box-containing protein
MPGEGPTPTLPPRRSSSTNDPLALLHERLLDREEQLQTAQEMAELGLWEWEVQTGEVAWSDQLHLIYGTDKNSFTPTREAHLVRVHPDDRERVAAVFEQALEDHQPFNFDERIVKPDGSIRVLHSRGRVIVDENDRPVRVFGVSQDMTEQRQAQEQAAQATVAMALANRLADLQRITEAALTHMGIDELLPELLARICNILGTESAAVLLMDEDGETLVLRAAHGAGADEKGFRLAVGGGFAGRVARERKMVVVDHHAHEQVLSPALREAGIESMVGVPLIVRGTLLGVLHVGSRQERTFQGDETALLELVADRTAMALEHAHHFDRERTTAETLQRALLPAKVPKLDGMSAEVRYVPASAGGAEIGGDWFDVIPLPDGRVGVVLGDVTGHGLEAAALMAQLRHSLRAYALEGMEPGTVADRLDNLIHTPDLERLATLIYAVVSSDRSVDYVNAGHLPPLLVNAGHDAHFLEVPGGVPIGTHTGTPYVTQHLTLAEDHILVLYTDGLIEKRGESISLGMERLRLAAIEGPGTARELADHLLRSLLPVGTGEDDIALLTFRPEPVTSSRAL